MLHGYTTIMETQRCMCVVNCRMLRIRFFLFAFAKLQKAILERIRFIRLADLYGANRSDAVSLRPPAHSLTHFSSPHCNVHTVLFQRVLTDTSVTPQDDADIKVVSGHDVLSNNNVRTSIVTCYSRCAYSTRSLPAKSISFLRPFPAVCTGQIFGQNRWWGSLSPSLP